MPSAIGDHVGDALPIAFVGVIARTALRLGPPGIFGIPAAACVAIGPVVGRSPARALAPAAREVLPANVCLDPTYA